jgi:hypothetical protein
VPGLVAPSQPQPRWLEHIDLPETMTLAVLLQLAGLALIL